MHPLFIHPAFPGPFAALAQHLAVRHRRRPVVLTHVDTTALQNLPFVHVNYRLGDNVPSPKTFTPPDSLHAHLEHLAAVYRGMRGVIDRLKPDLVVGHATFGTMLYLRRLYSCPFVAFLELYPPPFWGGLSLRPDYPATEAVELHAATYHALTLSHLQMCDGAYTHSAFQRGTAPEGYRGKIEVLPEGVDCAAFAPREVPRPAELFGRTIHPGDEVVTFAAPGLEAFHGFDRFMDLTRIVARRRKNALFVVVGSPVTLYGHEGAHLGGTTFKDHVLSRGDYDLSRVVFAENVNAQQLTQLYNLSSAHVSLTVPFPLVPTTLQAMASGCAVVGSDCAPVREVIDDGVHGLLAPFDDVEALGQKVVEVLHDREKARALGKAARERAESVYEINACLERQREYLDKIAPPKQPAEPVPPPPPSARDSAFETFDLR